MAYIIIILTSAVIFFWFGYFSGRKSLQKKSEIDNRRRGLIVNKFIHNYGIEKNEIEAIFEVIELERTEKKSKIKVLSCKTDQSLSNDSDSKKKMIDIIEGWVDSDRVEWFIPNSADVRQEKIDKILK